MTAPGVALSHEGFGGDGSGVHVWGDGFGTWHARVTFDGLGIGNTYEAEEVRRRAEHEARRLILDELAPREQATHETYEAAWKRQADALRLEVVASHEYPSTGTTGWIEWKEGDIVECDGGCVVEYADAADMPAEARAESPGAGAWASGFGGDYEGQPDWYVCEACGGEAEA